MGERKIWLRRADASTSPQPLVRDAKAWRAPISESASWLARSHVRVTQVGRSDAGIILWRKILARELRTIAEGRPAKRWRTAPADVVPTLGF
jgi:hypothetical protein